VRDGVRKNFHLITDCAQFESAFLNVAVEHLVEFLKFFFQALTHDGRGELAANSFQNGQFLVLEFGMRAGGCALSSKRNCFRKRKLRRWSMNASNCPTFSASLLSPPKNVFRQKTAANRATSQFSILNFLIAKKVYFRRPIFFFG